jgi:excisionase family DNA binding protein
VSEYAGPARTHGSSPSEIQANGNAGRLLTAQEAGALLSKTDRWVLAEARANRIPHVRLGRSVRFRRESLLLWSPSRSRVLVRV